MFFVKDWSGNLINLANKDVIKSVSEDSKTYVTAVSLSTYAYDTEDKKQLPGGGSRYTLFIGTEEQANEYIYRLLASINGHVPRKQHKKGKQ